MNGVAIRSTFNCSTLLGPEESKLQMSQDYPGFNFNQPNPYGQPAPQQGPPPSKPNSNMKWILLVVLGAVGGGVFVCCGGCLLLGLLGGGDDSAEQVRSQVENNPVLVQHIGQIHSFELQYLDSLGDDVGYDDWFYDVEGSLGSGRLIVTESTDSNFDTIVEAATLRMSDGSEYDLFPNSREINVPKQRFDGP